MSATKQESSLLGSAAAESKKYPIAEIFTSPQGEGLYTGVLMTFIRIAGCTVGKKIRAQDADWERWHAEGKSFSPTRELPIYTELCHTYDNRPFLCDTNFQTKEALTRGEIVSRIPSGVNHVCITGGEPLAQNLQPLLLALYQKEIYVHIETSGTRPLSESFANFKERDLMGLGPIASGWLWITVSPKLGVRTDMIELASEIKLLVDEDFDLERVPLAVLRKELVYLQPINNEFSIRDDNMKRCLEIQREQPHFRISSQAHKIWGVR